MSDQRLCEFCKAMDFNREMLAPSSPPEIRHEYSVAIVDRAFVKGQRDAKGSRTDYRYRGCGYKLNFCPECGRKMNEREGA